METQRTGSKRNLDSKCLSEQEYLDVIDKATKLHLEKKEEDLLEGNDPKRKGFSLQDVCRTADDLEIPREYIDEVLENQQVQHTAEKTKRRQNCQKHKPSTQQKLSNNLWDYVVSTGLVGVGAFSIYTGISELDLIRRYHESVGPIVYMIPFFSLSLITLGIGTICAAKDNIIQKR